MGGDRKTRPYALAPGTVIKKGVSYEDSRKVYHRGIVLYIGLRSRIAG